MVRKSARWPYGRTKNYFRVDIAGEREHVVFRGPKLVDGATRNLNAPAVRW